MASCFRSDKQRDLFKALEKCGELIFACGPNGVSANIVGSFRVLRRGHEDRLEMGDGAQHADIDWSRITQVEVSECSGEGMLTFSDGNDLLFRLYRPAGLFPSAVQTFAGSLI